MSEHSYHFVTLPALRRDNQQIERGFNLSQVVSYEYSEHGSDGAPFIMFIVSGGGKADFHGEEAKRLYVALRGKW